MATVYVHQIEAFDATQDKVITFGYSGAQCIKNKIAVYENETNAVVYENTVTTFSLSHKIPMAMLTNGVAYKCTITAYYMESNVEKSVTSSLSNVFICLSTPEWGLNISDGAIINNSYFTFIPNYSQAQDETINEYYIVIYNASGSVFWFSDALYDVNIQTTVNGLPNDTILYIRAYGTTINGFKFDTRDTITGLDIKVSVDYIAPTLYSLAYLENNKWQGYVKVKTNVASIEGYTASGNDPVFIGGQYIDLTNESVIFDENFTINGDFILQKVGYNISINKPYLKLIGENYEAVITFRKGTFEVGEKVFAEIKVKDTDYVIYSNLLEVPLPTDIIHLWLQRKNGLYMIKISNLGVV